MPAVYYLRKRGYRVHPLPGQKHRLEFRQHIRIGKHFELVTVQLDVQAREIRAFAKMEGM